MSKIIFEDSTMDVEPGFIVEACEEMGIPFGCREGNCGTCEIRVISGKEHLSPYSEAEQEFGLTDNHRLACQCVIAKDGCVEIEL